MGLFKALSGGVGLLGAILSCGAFWLLGAGAWALRHYDELQAPPSYQIHVLFFHWTLKPPHSLWPEYVLAVEARDAQAAKVAASVAQRQGAITAQAEQSAVQVETVTRWRTRTIQGAIPNVLPPETDRRYPLPNGLVRLYDASIAGVSLEALSNPAGAPDDAASAVTASQAGSIFVANNGECKVDQDRLVELQQWIVREQNVSPPNH